MSNVISLLESLAVTSRPLSDADYLRLSAGLPPEVQEALLQRDPRVLTALLDGRLTMACVIFTPDDGEEREPTDAPDAPDGPADEPESQSRAA